ncbi:MAG: response regulator transcription factor, partial [Candidatus Methylacidiphilales bacterium]
MISVATRIVHIVDDDESFSRATARSLKASGYTVELYVSATDFLARRQHEARGCVLADLQMPGPSGLELQTALATADNPLPVIFLTGTGDIPSTVIALKGGAEDFLTKPVLLADLVNAVDRALARDEQAAARRTREAAMRERFQRLTARETEVLRHVIAGRLNKEIGDRLSATERTIKAHRAAIMDKLGAGSPAELGRMTE